MNQYWSWILTAVGLTGFILAGRKVWWAWYVNIACQALWYAYAIVTEQWGFIVAATAYTVVFSQNAYKWTKEHQLKKQLLRATDVLGYSQEDIDLTMKLYYARYNKDEQA